jgi:cysteinyl-tRNA synthetase
MGEALKRLGQTDPEARPSAPQEELEQNLASFASDVSAYMNDDFNTAKVIARMFDALPAINQLAKSDSPSFGARPATFRSFRETFQQVFSDWLGLASEETGDSSHEALDGLMSLILDLRLDARKNKNWAVADQIRQQLTALGIKVEDSASGSEWHWDR